MKELDIHHSRQKLDIMMARVKVLPGNNGKLLQSFANEAFSHGLSNIRVLFYISKLLVLDRNYKRDFKSLEIEDIKGIVADIEKNENYTEWTKACYKLTIKKFFKWLEIGWDSESYPDKVKWIKAGARNSKLEDPIILTREEVVKLFNVAEGLREKALVSFMYESGCRSPDELFNIKIKDVEFNEYGAKVKLHSGKVGSRTILVISCVPHLKSWIDNGHPNPKSDSHLWAVIGTRNHGNVMSYSNLKKIISKWRRKAAIDKPITPYTFRRTRYTHLANKIPTSVLYKYMGQVINSRVIDRYVKLSSEDTDEAILSFYGITKPKNGDIKPLFCSKCGRQNAPELEFCTICNAPLTEKARVIAEDKNKEGIKEFVEMLVQKRVKELEAEREAKLHKL